MKKTVIFLLSAVFMLTIFSCGSDKPVENLNDLKEKYKDKEFKDCDEFLVAYEEAMDVYFKLINIVDEGNEEALKDIEGLENFVVNWDKDFEKFEKECPEKFEELNKKIDEKMDAYFESMYGDEFDEDMEDEMTDEEFAEILGQMTDEELAEFNAELEAELIEE